MVHKKIGAISSSYSSFRLFVLNTRYAKPMNANTRIGPVYRTLRINISMSHPYLDPAVMNICVKNGNEKNNKNDIK